MEISFKEVGPGAAAEVTSLTNECFNENASTDAVKSFIEAHQNKNQIYLAGYLENTLVAFALISIIETPFPGMDTYAILNHVCVKPEYRRHHLGTKLLTEVEKICEGKGVNSLKLWSKNFRIPAHALYQKFGFKIVDAKFFEKELNHED